MKDKQKQKQNEAMRRWRARPENRQKERERNKKYRQRPEAKERHRMKMAEWRKSNPDAQLEISRRSYEKNRHKLNAVRNEKYRTDENYRKRKAEAEKKYKATGRRKELRKRDAIKLRIKSAKWKKENPAKVREYVKGYRERRQIHVERNQREGLTDQYVVAVIKKSLNYKIKTQEIPKELIEIERLKIKTIRSLKNKTK